MPPGLRMLAACLMNVLPSVNDASCASWKGGFMITVSKGRLWGTSLVTSTQWYSIFVFSFLLDSVRLVLAHLSARWSSS